MIVYAVRHDINRYQSFLTLDSGDWKQLYMDCTSRKETWLPPEVYIPDENLHLGDFYNFNRDIIIAGPRALGALREFFEDSGEILPLTFNGQEYGVVNVTSCIDCLDHELTEWSYYEEGGKSLPLRITRHVFDVKKIPQSTLFKIPEEPHGFIFHVQEAGATKSRFRQRIESAGLQGLIFSTIWSDE